MSAAQYCGLTWDRPRGYNALAAAPEASGGLLHWDKQPPLEDLFTPDERHALLPKLRRGFFYAVSVVD
jgi:hypothetical protein